MTVFCTESLNLHGMLVTVFFDSIFRNTVFCKKKWFSKTVFFADFAVKKYCRDGISFWHCFHLNYFKHFKHFRSLVRSIFLDFHSKTFWTPIPKKSDVHSTKVLKVHTPKPSKQSTTLVTLFILGL